MAAGLARRCGVAISSLLAPNWALMAVGATWVSYFAALMLNFCDFYFNNFSSFSNEYVPVVVNCNDFPVALINIHDAGS